MTLNFDNNGIQPKEEGGGGGSEPVIESLGITPSTSSQTITAPSGIDGYSPISVSAVTSAIDNNITAGNIKSGVTILGTTGNYTGTTPTLKTKAITQNGTYNASSDNADGYSSVTVNVSSSGGGNDPDIALVFNSTKNGNAISGISTSYYTLKLGSNITDVNGSFTYGYGLFVGTGIMDNIQSLGAFAIDFDSLTTLSGNYALNYSFMNLVLKSVSFANLASVTGLNAFSNAFNSCMVDEMTQKTFTFPSLTTITGTRAFESAFSGIFAAEPVNIYFPALTTLGSLVSGKSVFYQMLENASYMKVHFPSNLQSIISSWDDYNNNFGGMTNTGDSDMDCEILFDLPSTANG